MATSFTRLIHADVVEGLRSLPARSVHCVVTSPPYFGLRTYGNIPPIRWADGSSSHLGLEPTIELYVDHLVEVFREVRRVLRDDGTFWLNLGDSYAAGGAHPEPRKYAVVDSQKPDRPRQRKLSSKDLLLVPHRVALALQADGWIVRQTNVWAKGVSFCRTYSGSVMPESCRDRTTHAHEYVFQLVKTPRYFYDIDACREAYADSTLRQVKEGYNGRGRKAYREAGVQNPSDVKRRVIASAAAGGGRNLRNVWVIPKQSFPGAHFATFPEALVDPIIRLGTSEKGVCEACGVQWQRKVIREPVPAEVQAAFEAARKATVAGTGRSDGHTQRKPNYRRRVLREEWEPGCGCREAEDGRQVAAVVLDPFVGSGRAGCVARRLGRSFIGIDANGDYIRMAADTIRECYIETDLRRSAADIRPSNETGAANSSSSGSTTGDEVAGGGCHGGCD